LPDAESVDIVTQNVVPGTHDTASRPTPLPRGRLALLHAEAPPAGLVEVITLPEELVATHNDANGQETSRVPALPIENGLDHTSGAACADAGATAPSTRTRPVM
jgi:hypothetical protein